MDWLNDPTGLELLYGWAGLLLLLGVAQDGLVLDMVVRIVGDLKNGMFDNAVRTRWWCCLCGSCCLREVDGLLGDCGW